MYEVVLHHHDHLLFDELFCLVEGSVFLVLVGSPAEDRGVDVDRPGEVTLDGLALSTPFSLL